MSTTTEHNKTAIRRFVEAWNNRQPEAFDELMAPDVLRHCQATPAVEVRSLEQVKEFLKQDTASFPDSRQTIVHMVAEGDFVAAWATYEGTQRGPIGPLPASGARNSIRLRRRLPHGRRQDRRMVGYLGQCNDPSTTRPYTEQLRLKPRGTRSVPRRAIISNSTSWRGPAPIPAPRLPFHEANA